VRNADYNLAGFSAALIIPQWQGAGRRIGYLNGIACLRDLLPASLPCHDVDCADDTDLAMQDGVKALPVLAKQADRAATLRYSLTGPVLTIGGDCGADLVNAAFSNLSEDAALVWIDGHADLNNPASSPSGHFHGMVARTLMGDGPESLTRHVTRPYRADQIFYAGLRDCDPAEADHIAKLSIAQTGISDRPARLVEAIKARGFSRLHLHLDLDSLDPTVFPYVGVPAAHGFTLDQLCDLLIELRRAFTIAGASITECNIANANEAEQACPLLRRILQEGFEIGL
jgi:arginase